MLISEGKLAPDFELVDDHRSTCHLSDFRGKNVILYFYPQDDTSGCTTEACNFRDSYEKYQSSGTVILGVSPDSVKSHVRFKEKYKLPFPLLADTEHKVCELYGTWGKKKSFGKEHDGVFRTTFLINPDGVIRKVFENVKPTDHSTEVLAALGI
jgi:thioredoxin-dependent peroxiredoxin